MRVADVYNAITEATQIQVGIEGSNREGTVWFQVSPDSFVRGIMTVPLNTEIEAEISRDGVLLWLGRHRP